MQAAVLPFSRYSTKASAVGQTEMTKFKEWITIISIVILNFKLISGQSEENTKLLMVNIFFFLHILNPLKGPSWFIANSPLNYFGCITNFY